MKEWLDLGYATSRVKKYLQTSENEIGAREKGRDVTQAWER